MSRTPSLKSLGLAATAALLLASACTGSGTTTTEMVPVTETTAAPSTTSTTLVGTTTSGDGDGGVDPAVASELEAQITDLIAITEELRGLAFLEIPQVQVMSSDDLAARIATDIQEDLAEVDIEVEAGLLELLGLLDEGVDLTELYLDVFGEQVAGFYDGDTKELVVQGDNAELSALSRSIVVHELVHALTDQHFGAWDIWQAMLDEDRLDEAAAYQGLLEGEATLIQTVYLTEELSPSDLLSVAVEVAETETAAFDAAPFFLREGLTFPYEEGFFFVQRLVTEGGLLAVNQAYEDPPTTTEQIIHPGRYLADEVGTAVASPDVALPPDYGLYESSVWGELGLVQLFGEVGGEGFAAQLADGWGGDGYAIWSRGDDVVFVLVYEADTARDAEELAEALGTLATESMDAGEGSPDDPAPGTDEETAGAVDRTIFATEDRFAAVERDGDLVVFVAATDPAVGLAAAHTNSLP